MAKFNVYKGKRNCKQDAIWSVHFGFVVVELINYKCGGIVGNEIQ